MKIEDIKIGETYSVRVRVIEKSEGTFTARPLSPRDEIMSYVPFYNREAAAFSPATNDFKHNPWRVFKKGDVVRVVDWYGRSPIFLKKYIGTIQIVACDEDSNGVVGIVGDIEAVYVANLELVTPVEENNPYSVFINAPGKACEVRKANKTTATFYYGSAAAYTEDEAEALAQAECDRLNEQYRKAEKNYEAGRIGAHGKY